MQDSVSKFVYPPLKILFFICLNYNLSLVDVYRHLCVTLGADSKGEEDTAG